MSGAIAGASGSPGTPAGGAGAAAGAGASGTVAPRAGAGGGGTGGAASGGAGAGGASGAAGGGAGAGGTAGSEVVGPWPPSDTFDNPVHWQDLADLEVIRVDDTFYYTASTMHYSPGAPILRSYDLVNWEMVGHSVPKLDFGARYDLGGERAYVKGIWASTLGYRESNQTFYWIGCIEFSRTYVFTATSVTGPWEQHPVINHCYYDAGLLIDDDDTMYVAYGATTISVAQLSADGLSQVGTQEVFTTPGSIGVLEGARFYKVDGDYYIVLTHPPDAEYVLRSSSGPFGPYEIRTLVEPVGSPVSGSGHPHQGGLVETQNGDWYYMSFIDAYPGGRIPVLAPVTWADGWPTVTLASGDWSASYPYPDVPRPPVATRPPTGTDTFADAALAPDWEWNHNPDDGKWSAGGKLTLQTATVTNDLYSARNTLTRRILGPESTATIELDYSMMQDGDRAGLALFRDSSAFIGVERSGGEHSVVMVNGLTLATGSWTTTGTGTEAASAPLSGGKVWLRITADIRPGPNRQARFSYSTDGATFTELGPAFTMTNAWQFFMGYRFAIFNFATEALGGSVSVESFTLEAP